MQATSALYKELFASEHETEIRIFINNVEYGMDKIVSLQTRLNSLGNSGSPSVGNVCAAEIDLVMRVPSLEIPRMAQLRPQVRLTDGERYSEWIEKGYFFVATREEDDDIWDETRTVSIHGFDAMLKCQQNMYTEEGDQDYWPKTDIEVVEDICYKMDVSLDIRTRSIITRGYTIPYPGFGSDGFSMSEMLGFIGSAYMGNWIITDNNRLRLIQLENRPNDETYLIRTETADILKIGSDHILWI